MNVVTVADNLLTPMEDISEHFLGVQRLTGQDINMNSHAIV